MQTLDGNQTYEMYGNIGELDYLSFGIKENRYSKDEPWSLLEKLISKI